MRVAHATALGNGTRSAATAGAWPRGLPGSGLARASGAGSRSPGRPRDTGLDTAILRAAVLQLAERGYAGMSMEGVAAAAGTTPPSLRRRFRDKLDLTMAAISAMRTEPLPRASDDPRADALAILENLRVNLARRNGMAILGTLLAEERRHPELLARFRQRIEDPASEGLRQALARGVRAGQLEPGLDPDTAVSLLVGSFYAQYLHSRRIPDDWAECVLRVIWPPPAAPGRPGAPRG